MTKKKTTKIPTAKVAKIGKAKPGESIKTVTVVEPEETTAMVKEIQGGPEDPRYTLKFMEWARLYTDPRDKTYFSNATQCALKVYSTDNYHSASQIGHENLRKLEIKSSRVLEAMDINFSKLMEMGMEKVKAGGYDEWERFMIRIGYFEPLSAGGSSNNTFNFDNLNMQINADRKARGLDIKDNV